MTGQSPARALDVERAREISRTIRCEIRPALLRRMRALANADDGNPAELSELEGRLLELESVENSVDVVLKDNGELASFHLRKPRFAEVETDSATYVRAFAPLFVCQLSRSFVHGPITVLHAVSLCETVLDGNERVISLPYVQWSKVVTSGIRLEIGPAHGGTEDLRRRAADENLSLIGRVETSAGRRLDFSATAVPNATIQDYAGMNECVMGMVGPVTHDGERTFRMPLRVPRAPDVAMAFDSPPVVAATLLDVLVAVGATAAQAQGRVFLAAVEGLPVPVELSALLDKGLACEFRMNRDRRREIKPGIYLTPNEYSFPPLQRDFRMCLTARIEGHFSSLLAG